MELFIGNLTPGTTLGELIALFKGFSKMARFRLEQKRLEDGTTVRYAVAVFDNEKYAHKMVARFHGTLFHGQALHIREYLHRSYTNERRALNWRDKPWRAGERRRDDRRYKEAAKPRDEFEEILAASREREQSLDEQADSVQVRAYANFARKD
ncbi:MAG: RNA-binding protein [Gammaproteobacteria bacterium]|nr:RNA-binding protein [Gammaproteobacteria bacterium]